MKQLKKILPLVLLIITVLSTQNTKAAFPVQKTKQASHSVAANETSSDIKESPIAHLKHKSLPNVKNTNGNGPLEVFGLISFIAGVLSLFILALPLSILAVVFGVISLYRFKDNPGKYSGKGFAIAGLVLGLIVLVLIVLILSLLFAILI